MMHKNDEAINSDTNRKMETPETPGQYGLNHYTHSITHTVTYALDIHNSKAHTHTHTHGRR